MLTAEKFGFDHVNTMSDPARGAADCGAPVEFFDDQPVALIEDRALLADKTRLATLKVPNPLGGGRMHNGNHPAKKRRVIVKIRVVRWPRPGDTPGDRWICLVQVLVLMRAARFAH